MPRLATQEITFRLDDFSRGIVGGISERGIARPNWLAGADNLYGRPLRGLRGRPGSRDVSSASLTDPPHSLMAYYSSGGNKLFVAAAAKIYEILVNAYQEQTLPAGHLASSNILTHTNLDGVLIVTQRSAATTPLMYDGAWKELKLPKPSAGPTFGANTAGGSVDARTNGPWYRVRWQHDKGSSLSGPATEAPDVVGGTQTVNITGNLNPGTPRSDYVGWTLERTKVNGTIDGPYWWVADGTSPTYADSKSDAQLGYLADEGLHGEPPHFDGVTSFAGRIWGWSGSLLYASQAIGDLEATGIANFDAELVYPIAKDDGDTIQVCVVVLDELLILKRRSVHIISGVDPESFVLTSVVYADPSRGSEAGCAGPRSACVIGGKAFFWGESGGLFTYSRGTVQPAGWVEVGRYLDEVNPAQLDKLLLINHQGNYMLAWYPRGASDLASDQIVYDARFKQWWHWKGWGARDAIETKGGLFNSATLVIADDVNKASFPAIPDGALIEDNYIIIDGGVVVPLTGAIQPGTIVAGAVPAGATTLTMSLPALQTLTNITLIINGIEVMHCNTVAGSVFVTASGYRCWALFDGFKDYKDVSGFGGQDVPVLAETPWLDGGLPDDWKDLDRMSFSADGDQADFIVSVLTDPPGAETSVSMSAASLGNNWAADTVSDPNDLVWDVGDWAADAPTTSPTGVRGGTIARRFKFIVSANVSGDVRPTGLEAIAVLLPDKEYDR